MTAPQTGEVPASPQDGGTTTLLAPAGSAEAGAAEPGPGTGADAQPRPPGILQPRFDRLGLLVAGLFFSLSLFPSLLPRSGAFQGVMSGITLALGYGVGTSLSAVWRWLGLPTPRGRVRAVTVAVLTAVVALAVAGSAWQYVGWQDDQRARMGMPPLSPSVWIVIALTALLVAALLLVVARLVRALARVVIRGLLRLLPRRAAIALGCLVVGVLLALLYSDVLVRGFWIGVNGIFAPRNGLEKAGVTGPPSSPERSGGPGSLVSWESLGREGRAFVSLGPNQQELAAQAPAGTSAVEPVRVFVGLDSAPSLQERADLVLAELKRTGAFDREVVVLATSTGSGFIDPASIDPLEHLWHGNTAVAGLQYSYLPSWLSLLADQQNVQQASQAVFRTVQDYWRTLPEQRRPKLYLYGLSLGSFGVQHVLTNVEMFNEPVDGVLMAGPPFVNPLHDRLTAGRDPGSPVWQPVFQEGRTVRFSARPSAFDAVPGPWGPVRIAYLQHDTDPVVWFSPRLVAEEPEWLQAGERGPNISPEFTWTPLVSVWQVLFDLTSAGSVPWGYGHLYLPSENAKAWVAVTQPPGWTAAEVDALGSRLDSGTS